MRDVLNHRLDWRVTNSLLMALALTVGLSCAVPVKADWDAKDYNPKPLPDDLILPMPCGGAMAFRPIATVSERQIDDVRIILGHADERFAFQEGPRESFISGAFTDASDYNRRIYFLGKYELTQLQLRALRGDCSTVKPTAKDRIPASGLTWSGAVQLTDQYSVWLLSHAITSVPREDGTPGYVRLPTEAEWEFAARGGLKVSKTEYLARLFPMPEGELRYYAWFAGTSSSQGKPKPVGLKKANPLGLHDMLGNLEEIVLDPFHLNHLGRLHGQPGGYMVKGGHYLTSQDAIRTAYRQEVPHYDDRGGRTGETVGVRFVITAPVLTTNQRLKALQVQWNDLAKTKPEVAAMAKPMSATPDLGASRADPLEELAVLRDAVPDATIKDRLNDLSLVIKANIAARDNERALAIRSFLRQGAFVSDQLLQAVRVAQRLEKSIKTMESAGAGAETLKKIYQNMDAHEKAITYNLEYYSDLVITLGDAYSDADLKTQRDVLKTELSEKNLKTLDRLAGVFYEHVLNYRHHKSVDLKKIRLFFDNLDIR